MTDADDERDRFEVLFRAHASRVHAYARRHIDPTLVDEVVAETFLVAWRRRDVVPVDDPMPWLLVTARHTVFNLRRRSARDLPSLRLWEVAAPSAPPVDDGVVDRATAIAALATLTAREREAVPLVAWDGLDPAGAARVAGCSTRAFTVRLHRARRRLARALDPPTALPDPVGSFSRSATTRLAEEV